MVLVLIIRCNFYYLKMAKILNLFLFVLLIFSTSIQSSSHDCISFFQKIPTLVQSHKALSLLISAGCAISLYYAVKNYQKSKSKDHKKRG